MTEKDIHFSTPVSIIYYYRDIETKKYNAYDCYHPAGKPF
jgi:hypothetical protein